ncbi:GUN4 domain-containing protein [Phormidesmis priestleyi]
MAQIEARPELKDLAKNPLLLTMIVTFHRRFPGAELPRRRVELYQEICRLQLKDRPGARKLETLLLECGAQVILQMLALEMMEKKEERVERGELVGRLARYLTVQGETVGAVEFLDQVVQVSELLIEQEDEYEFAHLSFQEYLAAAEVARLKQESLLYEKLWEDWWKQVILLYGGLVNPGGLIREMVRRGATDLAYVCWQEMTKRIDPALVEELRALKKEVQSSRYQRLEELLKNQRWEEADDETYRLMIKTVGKDEGQWFEREELLNFSCEELLGIDRLWVKYSGGRFGFSVQKELYLECGGIADGKYHREAIDRFYDTIGWTKYDFDSVDFDTAAPRGHLPTGVV